MRKIKLCNRPPNSNGKQERLVTWVNGHPVTVESIRGATQWIRNDKEEDIFISFAGHQKIEFRNSWVELADGEAVVIPRGVEYRPVTHEDIQILSF